MKFTKILGLGALMIVAACGTPQEFTASGAPVDMRSQFEQTTFGFSSPAAATPAARAAFVNGITPGVTTRGQIESRFGLPQRTSFANAAGQVVHYWDESNFATGGVLVRYAENSRNAIAIRVSNSEGAVRELSGGQVTTQAAPVQAAPAAAVAEEREPLFELECLIFCI